MAPDIDANGLSGANLTSRGDEQQPPTATDIDQAVRGLQSAQMEELMAQLAFSDPKLLHSINRPYAALTAVNASSAETAH